MYAPSVIKYHQEMPVTLLHIYIGVALVLRNPVFRNPRLPEGFQILVGKPRAEQGHLD